MCVCVCVCVCVYVYVCVCVCVCVHICGCLGLGVGRGMCGWECFELQARLLILVIMNAGVTLNKINNTLLLFILFLLRPTCK